MKLVKQSALFDEFSPQWLASQSAQQLFLRLLALFDNEVIYIVDKDQKVIYWSDGAEKLTGFSCKEIVDKPCLPEFMITDVNESLEQLIKLFHADGHLIEIIKIAQVLQDKRGVLRAA